MVPAWIPFVRPHPLDLTTLTRAEEVAAEYSDARSHLFALGNARVHAIVERDVAKELLVRLRLRALASKLAVPDAATLAEIYLAPGPKPLGVIRHEDQFPLTPQSGSASYVSLSAGVLFLALGGTDRAAAGRVAALCYGLGGFLFLLGAYGLLRSRGQRKAPRVARVTPTRYVSEPADGAAGARQEWKLEDFSRVLVQVTRHVNTLLAERTNGSTMHLFGGGAQLAPADLAPFTHVFESRAKACRAGVTGREEMRALEAYLDQPGEPLGIGIETVNGKRKRGAPLWRLDSRDDVAAALERGFVVYVPERPRKALALAHEQLHPLHVP